MDSGEPHTSQLTIWNNCPTTWAPPAPYVKQSWCQITPQVTGSLMQVSQRFWSRQWKMLQCRALLLIPPLSISGEKCRVPCAIQWNVIGEKSQLPSSKITLSCRTDRHLPSRPPSPLPYFVLCPSRGSPSLLTNPDPGDSCYQGGTKPRAGFSLLEEGSRRNRGLVVMLKAGLFSAREANE